jgi:hypothetical protein
LGEGGAEERDTEEEKKTSPLLQKLSTTIPNNSSSSSSSSSSSGKKNKDMDERYTPSYSNRIGVRRLLNLKSLKSLVVEVRIAPLYICITHKTHIY